MGCIHSWAGVRRAVTYPSFDARLPGAIRSAPPARHDPEREAVVRRVRKRLIAGRLGFPTTVP